ncbi:MAG: methyltransferase domain-containing protein [Parcubacteria group bacterium]
MKKIIKNSGDFIKITGEKFFQILRLFPPYLKQRESLKELYQIYLHSPSKSLLISNRGSILLAKSLISGNYFPIFNIGFVLISPNHGTELIDVGIVGKIENTPWIVRPESACAPSFTFGSQRCNCFDQWLSAIELASRFHKIDRKISMKGLEMNLKNPDNLFQGQNPTFVFIHLASQNGMGSGNQSSFTELTASAFLRHKGEYSAEQLFGLSMAQGFRKIGVKPDPRQSKNGFAYKIPPIILDYLQAPREIILLTNNPKKLTAFTSRGYDVTRMPLVGRLDKHCLKETNERMTEFGHIIPKQRLSQKQELDALEKKIKKVCKSDPDTEYIKNLNYFLEHSDEDKVDSEWFLQTLPIFAPQLWKKIKAGGIIKWLDVGTGPGTKPIKIIKILEKKYGSRIEFTALEPSTRWINIFKKNLKKHPRAQIKVIRAKWEEYAISQKKQFDLITFFHSMYGIKIVNGIFPSLTEVKKFLREKGVVCIIVESERSDLHKIKQEIFPELYRRSPISIETVKNTLKKHALAFNIDSNQKDQKLYVDTNSLGFLSFIAQTQPENYNRVVSEEVRKKIMISVTRIKKNSGQRTFLNIPDDFIWVNK